MSYNVSELLMSSLERMGISDVAQGSLDDHSTITLKLTDDNPDINIITQNDETWIWSVLGEFNQNALTFNSANLLPFMINSHSDNFIFGQPSLVEVEGNLEFRAQVKSENLESVTAFTDMLDAFFTQLMDYQAAMA
uniref:InvB n=1 Tax=Sodalis glossinidius TaxID=63612 RepID=Q9EZ20_SODGL|nr:InvB [Sodalis glossinidius]